MKAQVLDMTLAMAWKTQHHIQSLKENKSYIIKRMYNLYERDDVLRVVYELNLMVN